MSNTISKKRIQRWSLNLTAHRVTSYSGLSIPFSNGNDDILHYLGKEWPKVLLSHVPHLGPDYYGAAVQSEQGEKWKRAPQLDAPDYDEAHEKICQFLKTCAV